MRKQYTGEQRSELVGLFRPFIDGTMREEAGGYTVAFSTRPSWWVACFVSAWLVLFLAFDVALVLQEWKVGRPLRPAALLPVAVVLLVYSAWVLTIRSAGRRFEALLRLLKP
jgi:hypothetical protein